MKKVAMAVALLAAAGVLWLVNRPLGPLWLNDVEKAAYLEQLRAVNEEAFQKHLRWHNDCYGGRMPLPVYERRYQELVTWKANEHDLIRQRWGKHKTRR